MRLNARELTVSVTAAANEDAVRPVRIRHGGLLFSCTTTEALELANQLADVVAEINRHRQRRDRR